MTTGLILNTRTAYYHERFHDAFGELDWAIFDCPVARPEPVGDMYMPMATAFDAVIFTSQLGIASFASPPDWHAKKVYAVGEGTAAAATAAGFKDVVQTGLNVDDLRRHLRSMNFGTAFYPSADEVSADLAAEFPGRIRREIAYRMVPRTDVPQQLLASIKQGTPIAAPLFSRRAADILATILAQAGVTAANAHITAIGISANVVSDQGPWAARAVAAQPTQDALVAKTGEVIASASK